MKNRDILHYEIYPDSIINESEHYRFRRKIENFLAMGYNVKVVYAKLLRKKLKQEYLSLELLEKAHMITFSF